jgi:hypothetical protein
MNSNIQNLFRIIVISSGLMAILAPVIRILFTAGHAKGRTTGSGSVLRRWPAVLGLTIALMTLGILLWKPVPLPVTVSVRNILSWIGFAFYLPAISLYLWAF